MTTGRKVWLVISSAFNIESIILATFNENEVIALIQALQQALDNRTITDTTNLECQDCHQTKPDAHERKCPYDDDVHNKTTLVTICDDCEHERAMEI
jgi:hypothetical protein